MSMRTDVGMRKCLTHFSAPILGCGLALIFAGCAVAPLGEPLPEAARRATPLQFALFVTPDPAKNPITPPERFTGFHVGTDFEVTADELEEVVPVFAICGGTVAYSGTVEGYGGLVVQRCRIRGEDVTVLYGHLDLERLPSEDTLLDIDDQIGVLAAARSYASGFNRKHLHLGIHRGKRLDLRGYVQTEAEIAQFLDPLAVIPRSTIGEALPELEPYWRSDAGVP